MPQFDLRGIKVAKYVNTSGSISYTGGTSIGDAMSVDITMKYAEGRLYAESTLAEYMRKITGGTISIAEKYIPENAQKLMFGSREGSRTVSSKQIKGLKIGAKDESANVGVAFYCPDMVDGNLKYTCVFIPRCLFGLPSMSYQTQGENISFNTPTCTGEFMADHSSTQEMLETAVCDDEATAIAWVNAVLSIT